MADRDEILAFVDRTLDAHRFKDFAPQGLQVEGRREVRKVATGVSANLALFERAVEEGADLLLVHHGLFWAKDPRVVVGALRARLKLLLDSEMTLAAYHLPLDAHAEVGNNALALRDLGCVDLAPFGAEDGQTIGWRARFPEPVAAKDFVRRIGEYYRREPLVFAFGPDPVRTVGLVSGGGQSFLRQAIDARLDAFVTGEVSEWVMGLARESGIHFVSAGHYATERVGIRALGDLVAERFGVQHVFVDVPNPV